MRRVNFDSLLVAMRGREVERPNRASGGTLSGHATGEPFEKSVYHILKQSYPSAIFKQYEFLNDLYTKNPKVISVRDRYALLDSPTVLFLISRGDKATKEWSLDHLFEEKQNDTADILFRKDGYYDLIDVKTRNIVKDAQAPNIISAYKLARTCALMIDNEEYDTFGMKYIGIDWEENGDNLRCTDAHFGDLFLANPDTLYINWSAGLQVQFHVCDLDQSWQGSREEWARVYLSMFVRSAEHRCQYMRDRFIMPFVKYL
ncbi:MAG: HincII family type II restriction endonuclease [Bacteroidaceae bacterium]|nr:HincII family type II restriction endonuclease [Bacteroidaceae bacterium]